TCFVGDMTGLATSLRGGVRLRKERQNARDDQVGTLLDQKVSGAGHQFVAQVSRVSLKEPVWAAGVGESVVFADKVERRHRQADAGCVERKPKEVRDGVAIAPRGCSG